MRNKSLLIACLALALAFPAAASATFTAGDSPHIRPENGPAPAPRALPAAAPAVRTVVTGDGASNTLPTVLASVALGIALLGTWRVWRIAPKLR